MIEFYVRLFLNQIEYNFSITNNECLDKILTSITTCESSYRFMDTKSCSKIPAWACYDTEPSRPSPREASPGSVSIASLFGSLLSWFLNVVMESYAVKFE